MKAKLDKHLAREGWWGLAAFLTLATLTTPTAAAAEEAAASRTPPQAKAADARGGGLGEGLKVHGHWTIEVRNADGSLASRTQFKNRLAVPGDEPYAGVGNQILAALLGRASSVGLWEIQLHGVNIEICFDASAPVTHGCVITEASATNIGANYFRTLTVTPDLANGTVTLKGSARKQGGGVHPITHVGTALRTCASNIAPSTPCTVNQAGGNFTKTETPNPHPTVVDDQTIDVTVVLSFS